VILPDRDIRGLLKDVIAGGDPDLINPNGIELRLGKNVRFLSTGEELHLEPEQFLKVCPGETVLISSLEKIDFTRETVQKHFPKCMLMAFITPTTTMMREGILEASTKVDAGFGGILNWGLRNGSAKDPHPPVWRTDF
jgi:deoxycytidine triphosphate deaminase